MAAKNPMTEPSVKNAAIVETAPQVSADDAAKTPAQKAAEAPGAIADPAPATTFDDPSGAIVEPAITGGVNLGHEAIDANPRAGTTALQNAIDLNDAKKSNPADPDFAGEGIDMSVYGDRAAMASTGDAAASPVPATASTRDAATSPASAAGTTSDR